MCGLHAVDLIALYKTAGASRTVSHPGNRTAEGFAYELQQEKDSWLGQISL